MRECLDDLALHAAQKFHTSCLSVEFRSTCHMNFFGGATELTELGGGMDARLPSPDPSPFDVDSAKMKRLYNVGNSLSGSSGAPFVQSRERCDCGPDPTLGKGDKALADPGGPPCPKNLFKIMQF